jgi:hypothetical protein
VAYPEFKPGLHDDKVHVYFHHIMMEGN